MMAERLALLLRMVGAALVGACAAHNPHLMIAGPEVQRATVADPRDHIERRGVRFDIGFEPGAILLDVHNLTETNMQVLWCEIVLQRENGRPSPLRPDTDHSWIPPGQRLSSRLIPFIVAVPGEAGESFWLNIPLVADYERVVHRFHIVARPAARP